MELADEHGVGVVMVDNAFHYLWGALMLRASRKVHLLYVQTCRIEVARMNNDDPSVSFTEFSFLNGPLEHPVDRAIYIYNERIVTTCTGAIPEVVPFQGKVGTMGTNPWTWALPTAATRIGFDFVFDWATSVMSNGSVKALARAGRRVPEGAIVDRKGRPTLDPAELGAHQLVGTRLRPLRAHGAARGLGGGSLPSLRCAGGYTPYWKKGGGRRATAARRRRGRLVGTHRAAGREDELHLYFQVMRPTPPPARITP